MNIEKHCYVFDYSRGEIWHIDVKNYIGMPLDQYGDIEWDSLLEEQGFNSNKVEYMVTDKPLSIKEWFD